MTLAFDYSAPVAPAALRAAGCTLVMRYTTWLGWPKSLTHPEAVGLLGAGISIGANFESTANRMLGGAAAGRADAVEALGHLHDLGAPAGLRIWFSADWDVQPGDVQAVLDYLHAAAAALGGQQYVGLYGGLRACAAAAAAGFPIWQTTAWSGGQWDPRCAARQSGTRYVGGVQCDVDDILIPGVIGAWTPNGVVNMSLTNQDALTIWGYSHGDSPDVHQTLDNAAAWSGAANSKADAILAAVNALAARVSAPPAVDVNALAAALAPQLAAGASADSVAAAVVAHLAGQLAKP